MMNEDRNLTCLSDVFLKSMRINRKVFGEHAFRKSIITGTSRTVINVALFDIFSVEFSRWSEGTITEETKEKIKSIIRNLINDTEFNNAITLSTNNARQVKLRFARLEEAMNPIRQ